MHAVACETLQINKIHVCERSQVHVTQGTLHAAGSLPRTSPADALLSSDTLLRKFAEIGWLDAKLSDPFSFTQPRLRTFAVLTSDHRLPPTPQYFRGIPQIYKGVSCLNIYLPGPSCLAFPLPIFRGHYDMSRLIT
jgi:hypothetical protein